MTTQYVTAASYYPWATGPWAVLVIEVIANGRRTDARREFVIRKDKRAARKLAAQHNATPWNF